MYYKAIYVNPLKLCDIYVTYYDKNIAYVKYLR